MRCRRSPRQASWTAGQTSQGTAARGSGHSVSVRLRPAPGSSTLRRSSSSAEASQAEKFDAIGENEAAAGSTRLVFTKEGLACTIALATSEGMWLVPISCTLHQ